MAKFRIVMVEPEYEMNLGYAARLMKNFSQKPLYLVNSRCHIGFTARMHAKHAQDVIEKAKFCKSLGEAVKGCAFVVGTSGIVKRHRQALRHPMELESFRKKIENGEVGGEIALLFGREGIGLGEEEIKKCDLLITIPTSAKYPVMNLTHSMAVVLYALCSQEKKVKKTSASSDAKERAYLKKVIGRLVDSCAPHVRNPTKTKTAFMRVLGRAVPDETEVRAMLGVLAMIEKKINKKEGS